MTLDTTFITILNISQHLKQIGLILAVIISSQAFGQHSKSLEPTLGQLIELSIEGEKHYKKTEIIDLGYYDFVTFPFYDFKVSSSSQLKADTISYSADNVFDTSYKTAWFEGVSGYGVGEFVVIEIPSDNPITSLVFVTGFARSKELWLDNSRPKTIEMFVNEQPFATLTLRDARQEQCFQLNENNWHQFTSETWIIKFRITDVYEGKHDHTAITAIYLGNCK